MGYRDCFGRVYGVLIGTRALGIGLMSDDYTV